MPITQTIVCDICGAGMTEPQPGAGFQGWGALKGIALDGVENPTLCPEHLGALAQFADDLKHGRA